LKRTTARLVLGLGLVLVPVLALMLVVFPVGAAPRAQDIPTPTPYPAENTPYTLDVVGGNADPLTFPGAEIEGFTIGATTVMSHYPQGMEFRVKAESEGGAIQDVILFIAFVHGTNTRAVAEYDDTTGEWVARPWETDLGRPAWTHFDFYWRVRDASEKSVETEPVPMDYWDGTREWFRMESDHVVLYWFGFGEDVKEQIAQKMADAMAATHERRMAGFGRALSYKPIAVVYPSRDALGEIYGGVTNDRVAGFTSNDLGMSVQTLRDDQMVRGNEECIYALQPEEWTMERRINTIYHTTTHEIVHLYQFDILGGSLGPEWWTEGQPEWFGIAPGTYDERLRHLATLQDIPSLYTQIGSDQTQADGCYALSYDVGPSFLNYLLANYGGVEIHLKIVELMRGEGLSVYEAVESVTGKPFLEVENEWRAYLGYQPLDLADVDPASALEAPVDPIAAEGDQVTLPASPALSSLYENPGPNQLGNGQCFANTTVTILKVGSLDGIDYYQVDCMGMVGWMTRDQLGGE